MIRNSKAAKEVMRAVEAGYTMTRDGRLFNPKGKEIIGFFSDKAYRQTRLKKFTANICFHQIQAYIKFGEAALYKGIEVRHLDGNPENNHWDNIAIGTPKQNANDKPASTRLRAAKIAAKARRKLTDHQVKRIRQMRREGATYALIMSELSIKSKSTVSDIINGKLYPEV